MPPYLKHAHVNGLTPDLEAKRKKKSNKPLITSESVHKACKFGERERNQEREGDGKIWVVALSIYQRAFPCL